MRSGTSYSLERPIEVIGQSFHDLHGRSGNARNRLIERITNACVQITRVETLVALVQRNEVLDEQILASAI